jgi:hypothetical protein
MIRRISQSALCLLLSPLLVAQQNTRLTNLQLGKDTEIHLRLDQDVSSASVREGDRVRYVVVDDVLVDGVVVIPAGAAAYQRVTLVQPAKNGPTCGDVQNGWFNLDEDVKLSSRGVEMKMRAWRKEDLPKGPKSNGKDVAIGVLLAPFAIAVTIALPIVLIPYGIAGGVHDKLHPAQRNLQVPQPYADAQALEVTGVDLQETVRPPEEPEPAAKGPTPVSPQFAQTSPRPQWTFTQVPVISDSLESTHVAAPAGHCVANAHEMVLKASEAKVKTYYLARGYAVHSARTAASSAGHVKMAQ